MVGGRHLAKAGTVGVDLEDMPPPVRPDRRKEHSVGVEVEIDVADESPPAGFVERCQRSSRPDRRKDGDLVMIAGCRDARIALPVVRQAEIVRAAFDQQQTIKIQQRIGQQRLALKSKESLRLLQRSLIALGQAFQDFRQMLRVRGYAR